MACNNRLVFLKQFHHLRLCQPYGVIFQPYIHRRLPVAGLVNSHPP